MDGGGSGSMLQHYAVLAAREKDHFRPGGAARVVATTIRTIAENKASPTSWSVVTMRVLLGLLSGAVGIRTRYNLK